MSEHHNHGTIAGTAPEILIAAIAATTKTIRIGSAGVMLPHYAPFKVAEQFRVLEAIAPGRIDLGLGRAPGSDGRTAFALNPLANERPAVFPNDVRDLMAWVSGAPLPEGHPFRQVKAYPLGDTSPEVWMLGSSDYGAQVAAHFGLPYAFAWFFTDGKGGPEALELYRELYQAERAASQAAQRAVRMGAGRGDGGGGAVSLLLARAREDPARQGHLRAARAAGGGAAHAYSEAEAARIAEMRKVTFVGTGAQVAERIDELARRLDVQEMAVVTWAYDEAVRRESYRLLAEAMGMGGS